MVQIVWFTTDVPFSSGFGKRTVGKSGSGHCCCCTGKYCPNPNTENPLATNGSLTPCIDVLVNLIGVFAFNTLKRNISGSIMMMLDEGEYLERHKPAKLVKYASRISSVRSRQSDEEENRSASQVFGWRLTLIESDMPVSCGPMILVQVSARWGRIYGDNHIPEQRFPNTPGCFAFNI